MNRLAHDARIMDQTFEQWQDRLDRFAADSHCHDSILFEFLSKSSHAVNTFFTAFLRLTEIQDILHQLSSLTSKAMFGSTAFPRFLDTEIQAKLQADQDLQYTARALLDGFSVLLNPMVDIEHHGTRVSTSLLFTIPQIPYCDAFCVIEYLSPIKFNVSNVCYTGPVTATVLALISCPHSKQIVTTAMLQKCYQDDLTFACPLSVLDFATNIAWLGFPFNHKTKLPFPRHHTRAPDCTDLHPMIHLGEPTPHDPPGRTYLATASTKLELSTGPHLTAPLTVYQFPCNITFSGMVTGLGTCPTRTTVTIPLTTASTLHYVPWTDAMANTSQLNLRHQELDIPVPEQLNQTILATLEQTYQALDRRFSTTLHQTNQNIHHIDHHDKHNRHHRLRGPSDEPPGPMHPDSGAYLDA